MPIEILTVSLSDESIERLAQHIVQITRMNAQVEVPVTQSNYPSSQNPQGAERPASAPEADPWLNNGGPPAPPQQQYQQPVQQSQPPQQQPQPPMCQHGQMRYVPAGFSKSTGRAYPAFFGCSAPRGAQDKCASVPA